MFNPKKIFALALLFAVVAPLLFFAGYLVKQSLIQNEMEEQLETKALQTITTDLTGVQWLKKNKEVIIEGKLFDVKSYTITGNKIILTGLFDKDEDPRYFELVNNSTTDIYYGLSYSYPDTGLNKIEDIPYNGKIALIVKSQSSANVATVSLSVDSIMQIFIFDSRVIENYSLDSIKVHNKVLKRIEYTKSYLQKQNWKIIFNGN